MRVLKASYLLLSTVASILLTGCYRAQEYPIGWGALLESGQEISGVFQAAEGTKMLDDYTKQDSLYFILVGSNPRLTDKDAIEIRKMGGTTRIAVGQHPELSRDLVAGEDYKNENGYDVFDRKSGAQDADIGLTWERYHYELSMASDHFLVARKTRRQYSVILLPPFFFFSKDIEWLRWKSLP